MYSIVLTFSCGLFFWNTANTSSKIHSTKVKTIGDKNYCNPFAFLPWPVCKTWSFMSMMAKTFWWCQNEVEEKSAQHSNELVKSTAILIIKLLLQICSFKLPQAHEKFSLQRIAPYRCMFFICSKLWKTRIVLTFWWRRTSVVCLWAACSCDVYRRGSGCSHDPFQAGLGHHPCTARLPAVHHSLQWVTDPCKIHSSHGQYVASVWLLCVTAVCA